MKLTAIALVFVSMLMIIYNFVQSENRHLADLKKVISIMTEIKCCALQYLVPFSEIINVYITDSSKCADFIIKFCTKNISSPPESWKYAVKNSNMFLSEDERECLIAFGEAMCRCGREQIEEYSFKFINELSEKYIMLTENKDKRIKTVTGLVISVGLTVILLLI